MCTKVVVAPATPGTRSRLGQSHYDLPIDPHTRAT
jgi:hypothetical protein